MWRRLRFPPGLIAALIIVSTPGFAAAATFVVNSTADAVDAAPGDGACATAGGACTLRAAVQEANGPGQYGEGRVNTITLPAGTYVLTIPGQSEPASAGDLDVIGSSRSTARAPPRRSSTAAHSTVCSASSTPRPPHAARRHRAERRQGRRAGRRDLRARTIVLVDSAVRDNIASIGADLRSCRDARQERGDRNSSSVFCGGIRSYDTTIVESTVSDNHTLGHGEESPQR